MRTNTHHPSPSPSSETGTKQTLSRITLDPYIVERLLAERGSELLAATSVQDCWAAAGSDELARREVLLTQLESLRIRRGVVGRYFDEERVLLLWRPKLVPAGTCQTATTDLQP